ncbi:hypothetical protein BKA62DRAFT_694090 [Auriculariales sp. MPI-PUGE-AT-0066]|nr:hypothetical protein BKA62DRAFT_694090 [Auriculariales sp. MPI-PUGE-AT-0066]
MSCTPSCSSLASTKAAPATCSVDLARHMTRLPIELVRDIIETAAKERIHTHSLWTADLSLVCKNVREWVLPIVYKVFFVEYWVDATETRPRHLHPSRVYFKYLLNTPKATARRYIRHLVIMGVAFDGLIGSTGSDATAQRTDWELESLVLPNEKVDFALQARIKPRRTFATDEYRSTTPVNIALEMAAFERAEHCRWTPSLADGTSSCRVVALRTPIDLMAPRYFHLQLTAATTDRAAALTHTCAAARSALNAHPGVRVVFSVPDTEEGGVAVQSLRDTFKDSPFAARVRLSRIIWDENTYHSAAENVRHLRDRRDPWNIGVPL